MKKIVPLLIFIMFLSSFAKNNINTFRGHIKSYSNVPFNFYAFEVENDKNTILKFKEDKYSQKQLSSMQGKLLEITGIVTKEKNGKIVEYYIDPTEIKIID